MLVDDRWGANKLGLGRPLKFEPGIAIATYG
jgi:hypothetical protein